jgi:Arc/MetJ-type ribon-helix-helix transcriptional regulator
MVRDAQAALRRALKKLEAQKAAIESDLKAMRSALGALGAGSSALSRRRRRKPMTSAERRSVSKRMKAYWAKKRSQ